ncbi:hypothetical protein IV203_010562 [Nitzschia inconspicua]|uniref:Uncharacterized protein n=1 Tax=Nitzschia inconspicua TaxID=303405 RepID=A0A9K3KXC3_9STRA|nr:hypothetical protein IV203_010562 [Nitzschia inconspicua]
MVAGESKKALTEAVDSRKGAIRELMAKPYVTPFSQGNFIEYENLIFSLSCRAGDTAIRTSKLARCKCVATFAGSEEMQNCPILRLDEDAANLKLQDEAQKKAERTTCKRKLKSAQDEEAEGMANQRAKAHCIQNNAKEFVHNREQQDGAVQPPVKQGNVVGHNNTVNFNQSAKAHCIQNNAKELIRNREQQHGVVQPPAQQGMIVGLTNTLNCIPQAIMNRNQMVKFAPYMRVPAPYFPAVMPFPLPVNCLRPAALPFPLPVNGMRPAVMPFPPPANCMRPAVMPFPPQVNCMRPAVAGQTMAPITGYSPNVHRKQKRSRGKCKGPRNPPTCIYCKDSPDPEVRNSAKDCPGRWPRGRCQKAVVK